MVLPLSGQITMTQIRAEFKSPATGAAPLSDFYRGGAFVPNIPPNAGIPTSGQIQLDDFYGGSRGTATWTARTLSPAPGSQAVIDIAYGGNFILTAGQEAIYYSTTGISWTQLINPLPNCVVSAVGFNSGAYLLATRSNFSTNVHVGISGTASGPYSNNTMGVSFQPTAIAFGAGLYVVVGNAGECYTSPDTLSWTPRVSSFGGTSIRKLIYAGGQFVAVGNTETVATSPDGVTWTQRGPLPFSGTPDTVGITYGNGLYLAVANANNFTSAATSPDGITWTARSSRGNDCSRSGGGYFFSAPSSGITAATYSADGINWFSTNKPTASDFVFAVEGDGGTRFVVGGTNSGASAYRLFTVDIT